MNRILEANDPEPSRPVAVLAQDVDSLLAQIGSSVARDVSTLNMLSGATVRRGISAFLVVTVIGQNGIPVIGQKVVNLFPDGNGEVIETDGSGTARFQFGASSAFTNPGSGPFTVFLADDSAFKDSDSIPKRVAYKTKLSDTVHSLGDFQGEHTEIYLQFVERSAAPVQPPAVIPVLSAPLDVALRTLAWNRRGIDFNPEAALFKIAQHAGLGYPLSGEFNFKDATGRLFVAQLYAGGIVWCEVGHYGLADVVVTTWL